MWRVGIVCVYKRAAQVTLVMTEMFGIMTYRCQYLDCDIVLCVCKMLLPLEEIEHNRISLSYFLQLHENLQLF